MASRRSVRLGRTCSRIGHTTRRGQCQRCMAIVKGLFPVLPPFVTHRHRLTLAMVNALVAQRRAIARANRQPLTSEPVFELLDKPAPKKRIYIAFPP